MFVVMTNYAGAFLYPEGYLNVAQNPYQQDDYSDLRSHLTNEHLAKKNPMSSKYPQIDSTFSGHCIHK